jgi:hypothetical protein
MESCAASSILSCFFDVSSVADWAGIITFVSGFIALVWSYRRGAEYAILKEKEAGELKALISSEKLRKRANLRITAYRRYDPRSWPKSLTSPDELSNLEKAFERSARHTKTAMVRLADYYLDQVLNDSTALKKSLRYARLAYSMDEYDPKMFYKLAEVEAVQAFFSEQGDLNTSDAENYSMSSDADITPDTVIGYVSGLIVNGRNYAVEDDRMMEVMLRRARSVALRHLGQKHDLTLIARQLWAEALHGVESYSEAFLEFEDILPDMKDVFGPISRRVFDVMVAMFWSLIALGREAEAGLLHPEISKLGDELDKIPPTSEEEAESREDLKKMIELGLLKGKDDPPSD